MKPSEEKGAVDRTVPANSHDPTQDLVIKRMLVFRAVFSVGDQMGFSGWGC